MRRQGFAIRVAAGTLLLAWTAAACGMPLPVADGTPAPGKAVASPVSVAPSSASAPTQRVVPVNLPMGLRTALYDDASGSLWILSDVPDPGAVLLTQISRAGTADERVETVRLSTENTDWQRGALAVTGSDVWAAWGTHLVRFDSITKDITEIDTPWSAQGGPDGRVASIAATSDAVWVAVAGEPNLRKFNVLQDAWTTTAAPSGTAVSAFTDLAVSGSIVVANLGSESTSLTTPATGADAVWVPENDLPLSSAGRVAVVGAAGAVLTGHEPVAFTDRSTSPAVVTPTGFNGTSVTRVLQTQGRIVIAHTDLATGQSHVQAIAASTVPLPPGPPVSSVAPSPRTGWAAAEVNAVASAPDGATWVVTRYGTDAPAGWGTVVYVPPAA